MATGLTDIRAALTTAVRAVVTDAQMTGYILPNPTAPAFELQLHENDGIVYDRAMARGLDEYNLLLRGFVSNGFELAAQQRLDDWLQPSGGESIKGAIEADRTLGGIVQDTHVIRVSGHRAIAVVKSDMTHGLYMGVEWHVYILGRGV